MKLVRRGLPNLSYFQFRGYLISTNRQRCYETSPCRWGARWGQFADRLERGREACEARLEALEKHARLVRRLSYRSSAEGHFNSDPLYNPALGLKAMQWWQKQTSRLRMWFKASTQ